MSNTALIATASEKRAAAMANARKLEMLYCAHARAYAGKVAGDPFAAREAARLERAIELLTTGE